MANSSLSKGVFCFKGSKSSANSDDYFNDGLSNKNLSRLTMCEEFFELIEQKVNIIQSDSNTSIFDELISYINKWHTEFKVEDGDSSMRNILIPTAALVTGVNTPDHEIMFSNLQNLLRENVSPHIVSLKSKDCYNLKITLFSFISQLVKNIDMTLDHEYDGDPFAKLHSVNCTMNILDIWYQDFCANNKKQSKLIVILEDFELFPPSVLTDLICICSNHLYKLPIIMIFGIATSISVVHRLLPHSSSSLMSLEMFQAPLATEYLDTVLNEIIITSEISFKLGYKVFNLILDMFLYDNFSVSDFVNAFQYCCIEHFYVNPNAILCQDSNDVSSLIQAFSHGDLENLRKLDSFRKYVEQSSNENQIALLLDDKFTKKHIKSLLNEIDSYHRNFFVFVRILNMMTKNLPNSPVGKRLRELYSMCIKSDIFETNEYNQCITLLRSLSRDELIDLVTNVLNSFQDLSYQTDEVKNVCISLQSLSNELITLDVNDETSNDFEVKTLPKMDMDTLKKQLLEKKNKKLGKYEILRNDIIDKFDSTFKMFLMCPSNLPLHEIYYFNDLTAVRSNLNGGPRATIHTALSKPHTYLNHPDLLIDNSNITSNLPDICIAYKLHLECGRLINLYDWMQAFLTIIQGENYSKTKSKKVDRTLHARFIKAVSELQFLGFLKSSRRKTDHVTRLTFGNC